jgi:hypothetical protein
MNGKRAAKIARFGVCFQVFQRKTARQQFEILFLHEASGPGHRKGCAAIRPTPTCRRNNQLQIILTMIIERNEFRIKFGKMREAKAIWLEIIRILKEETDLKTRVLTDISGPAYSLVLEIELTDLNHFEQNFRREMSNTRVRELYQQFIPICDSSARTFYTIEYDG